MRDGDSLDQAFILQDIYPDASSLFKTWIKPIEEIKNECLIVLDTNPLLIPYEITPKTLNDIKKTYKQLLQGKRLFIPAQVSREFARQRTEKIKELFQQLSRHALNLPKIYKGRYPLLESFEGYESIIGKEQELDDKINQYKKSIGIILQYVRNWTWNDPVSQMYSELFTTDVIIKPLEDEETIRKQFERRNQLDIPPGYKDASKGTNSGGDFLIWKSILALGDSKKRSVIFVTGDAKADWWHRSEGQALYPRFELSDEYRRVSGEQSFHMVQFSGLFDLFGSDKQVVDEIRKKENEMNLSIINKRGYIGQRGYMAEQAVLKWIPEKFSPSHIEHYQVGGGPDFILSINDEQRIGIEVKYFSKIEVPTRRLRETVMRGFHDINNKKYDILAIVLVTDNIEKAVGIEKYLRRINKEVPATIIYTGYLNEDSRFIEVNELRY